MGCDRETEPRCCDVRLTSARVLNLLNLKTHREHFIRVRFSHLRVFWQIFSSSGLVFSRLYSYWPFGGVLAHFLEESYPSPFSNKLR